MTAEELAHAIDIVRNSGGIEYTKKKVQEFLNTARKVLPEDLPAEVRETYLMVVDFIGGREF